LRAESTRGMKTGTDTCFVISELPEQRYNETIKCSRLLIDCDASDICHCDKTNFCCIFNFRYSAYFDVTSYFNITV